MFRKHGRAARTQVRCCRTSAARALLRM